MNKLKTIRKQSGLKVKEIAEKMGVSRLTLWNYENGKRKPTFETIVKLSKIYGVSVSDFVSD